MFGRFLRPAIKSAAGGFVLSLFVSSRLVTLTIVDGKSMSPTINESSEYSYVLVEKLTPIRKFKKDDIVLSHDPEEHNKFIVKRIKALEGQFVEFDAENPSDEYIKKYSYKGKLSVPRGNCWVEGDNKSVSVDSRKFGPIPLGFIVGRVFLIRKNWSFKLL